MKDVVKANVLAIENKGAIGKTMNIASATATSINELAKNVQELAGLNERTIHEKERPGEVKDSLASISLAKELLGYAPRTPLKAGLNETADYFKRK